MSKKDPTRVGLEPASAKLQDVRESDVMPETPKPARRKKPVRKYQRKISPAASGRFLFKDAP